jgi:hypothetical protein
MKSLIAALVVPGLALARPVTLSVTMAEYGGPGANPGI